MNHKRYCKILKLYIKAKMWYGDHHAVRDASVDLEIAEAVLRALKRERKRK